MLNKSSRHAQPRQIRSNAPIALDNTYSDASSVSQSTVGPLQTSGNLTSASNIPLDEVHAHINDPNVYAPPTPSMVHSVEKEPATLTTSGALTASVDATTYQRDSAQRVSSPEQRLEGTLFTPQDAIIAQLFGRSATDPTHAAPPPPSNAPQPPASLMTSDSLPPPPSAQTPPSSSTRLGPTLPIYDPSSGVRLGERTPMSPFVTTPGELFPFAPLPTMDDRKLWSSLERILELQAEIATMHADMEGVGGRGSGNTHTGGVGTGESKVGSRKGSRRSQTLLVGDEETEEHEPESGAGIGIAVSEISTDHSDGEDGDEDEDEDDIHGYGKRRRDEEFARLAEQFAQRKAAIGGIMNKLDDLSMALKTFHALPPPLFDLAMSPSRTDTMSSAPSNFSATSSPPLQVYPGQPSSPLSSISPSQAMSSVTLPTVSLSPPVPPISTLAPSKALGDAPVPPGRGHLIAPVLPRTAVQKIISGAAQVESPADMEPAQSILQGMP